MKTYIKTQFLTAGHAIFSAVPHLCSVFHIVESEKAKILNKHAELQDEFFDHLSYQGSPKAHLVKNPLAMRETCDPWVRKIPWRREQLPTPVFLPGEFHGQGSLGGLQSMGLKS